MRKPDSTSPLDLAPGDYSKSRIGVNDQNYETWWLLTPNGLLGRIAVHGSGELPERQGHRVEEHEDGTISVMPHPESSNSILVTDGLNSWHGYIDHGEWKEA